MVLLHQPLEVTIEEVSLAVARTLGLARLRVDGHAEVDCGQATLSFDQVLQVLVTEDTMHR